MAKLTISKMSMLDFVDKAYVDRPYKKLHDCTIEDVVEYFSIEKIENYIRKKKIERLKNDV